MILDSGLLFWATLYIRTTLLCVFDDRLSAAVYVNEVTVAIVAASILEVLPCYIEAVLRRKLTYAYKLLCAELIRIIHQSKCTVRE